MSFSSEASEKSFKSEQDKLLKSSNIFKQAKNQFSQQCPKHPSKKAKYYVQNDRRTLFCSKCALNMALQGLKIEEQESDMLRQERINAFSQQVAQVVDCCSLRLGECNEQQQLSMKEFCDQKENCVHFFDQVINTANLLRQTYISRIANDHNSQMAIISDQITLIQQYQEQLRQFQIDIDLNHDNIVSRMEMKPFEEIMTRYERRVTQTKQQLNDINLTFIQKQMNFDQSQILMYMNKMCYNLLLKTESENQTRRQSSNYNGSIDMKVFEQMDDIYQSTYSNPIAKEKNISHAVSRRESNVNTPDSLRKTNEKQKTLIEQQLQQPLLQNLSILEEPHQTTPRDKLKKGSNGHSSQKSTAYHQLASFQEHNKIKYESVQNIKSLTPLNHIELKAPKRSNSKVKSIDTIDNKRQFILANIAQYTSQPPQPLQQEESLKDRILKELTSHPSDSVYNQVLKLNNKGKGRYLNKENSTNDWSNTLRRQPPKK